MRWLGSRLSRREVALVAAALLVPMPVFAMTGLNAPLPNAIERGLGGLVTIEAHDGQSGAPARLHASENGAKATRSANASVVVTRPRRGMAAKRGGASQPSSKAGTRTGTSPNSGGRTTAEKHSPEGGAGEKGGSPSVGGKAGAAGNSSTASSERALPPVQIEAAGPGAGADASGSPEGLSVDVEADGADAGAGEPGRADATVTTSDQSSTGVGVDIPAIGISIP